MTGAVLLRQLSLQLFLELGDTLLRRQVFFALRENASLGVLLFHAALMKFIRSAVLLD
jgi:hypothetical protein